MPASSAPVPPAPRSGNRFGTFGGVFTPSILTILGVIMFLRAGFIIGQAGALQAGAILGIAEAIVGLTALSIAAISTNTPVRGGGAYFLISRALGPAFGGSIGIALFFAQALSVPLYILGFTEALLESVPALRGHAAAVNLATAGTLFAVNYFGARWAIKVQYLVMTLLALAVITFLGGAALRFDAAQLADNLAPAYTGGIDFWAAFAIYFPAVTGIMAGVNMSGDLKDPARSLVRGTFWAIGVGFAIYLAQVILCGGSQTRQQLTGAPYATLLEHALFGAGFLVAAGVYAATLSSAIGSFLGAPRVLQALGRDKVLGPLRGFGEGAGPTNEPRRALAITLAIAALVLVTAGARGSEGLNRVAAVVTMFFLGTYGMVNLAAFVEAASANPSFRPRFRYFHWGTSLLGATACAAAMLLIDAVAALLASAVIAMLFLLIRRQAAQSTYGDARRGFIYGSVSKNLLRLRDLAPHPKNWRPTILVLSGNPYSRLNLVLLGVWMEAGSGIITLAQLIVGPFAERMDEREREQEKLERFIADNDLAVFPEVVVAPDFDEGIRLMLQTHSIGPIKPNLVMMGWPREPGRIVPFVQHLADIRALGRSAIVVVDRGLPAPGTARQIDIWWRGKANGSLMLILAHLLARNWEWAAARIRILRAAESEAGLDPARRALTRLIEVARVAAHPEVVLLDGSFADLLRRHSDGADLVFLGFEPVRLGEAAAFHARYESLLDGMPTTVLVNSTGEADLLA